MMVNGNRASSWPTQPLWLCRQRLPPIAEAWRDLLFGAIGEILRDSIDFRGVMLPTKGIGGHVCKAGKMLRHIWCIRRRCDVERKLTSDDT